MNRKKNLVLLALTAFLVLTAGCSKKSPDSEELAQNIGDQMSAIDEGGGSSAGTYSMNEAYGARRTFARLLPSEVSGSWFERTFLPSAGATSCLLDAINEFSSCSGNSIVRTFGGCTVLGATFTGTVTFGWTNATNNCTLPSDGNSVSRKPDYTITGLRGGTFTAKATGTHGQMITRVGNSGSTFHFSNDGIQRVLKDSSSATLLDFTTATTADLTISGTSRSGRTLDGGTLHVTDNTSGATCDFSPSNVKWGAGCNCATSGSWTGTCSDGKTATYTINGCGTGSLDLNGAATDVTLDRCYGS